MSDQALPAQAEPVVVVQQSPAAAAAAKSAKERASAEKWGKIASDLLNGKAPEEPAEEAKTEAKPAKKADKAEAKPTGKPRGDNGQFLASKEKADATKVDSAKAEGVAGGEGRDGKPAKGDATSLDKEPAGASGKEGEGERSKGDEGPALTGGLSRFRSLLSEGKAAEAFRMLNLPADKVPNGMWVALRKEADKREAKILQAHQEVESQREHVRAEARQLVTELRPFAEAKQAIEEGDDEKAFQILWGKSANDWQREQLAKMHRGDIRKDPAIAAIQKELADTKRLLRERDERDERAAVEAESKRAQAEFIQGLTDRLSSHDDERVANAASKPWFVRMVRDEMRKHYDPHTDSTITEDEAVESVFDPERLTVAQWRELTGDEPGQRVPGTQTRASTDPRGNEAKRPAKAATSLSRSATVEAAPERKRTPKESLEHWSGIASRLAAQGR